MQKPLPLRCAALIVPEDNVFHFLAAQRVAAVHQNPGNTVSDLIFRNVWSTIACSLSVKTISGNGEDLKRDLQTLKLNIFLCSGR